MTDKREIKELTGWMSLPVAADALGLSRQWFYDMVTRDDRALSNVRRVRGTGDRPAAILVRTAEVDRLRLARAAAEGCPECRRTAEQAAAAGHPVDAARMLCEHRPAEAAPDRELADALGMADL